MKSVIKRIFKISIIIIIYLIFIEQGARFILYGFDSFSYTKMNSIHSIGVSERLRPSPHLEIMYELKPNADIYYMTVRFKTNSQGLRDKEYSIAKPKNTFRVAVLGDSFTMGSGVDIENVFHSIIENRLNTESNGITYEFINFGVSGYDPTHYLATIKYKALEYSPELILFCQSAPFEEFYPRKYFQHIYKIKPKSYAFFESFFWKMVENIIKSMKVKSPPAYIEASIQKTENVFAELKQISKNINIPICVVILQNHHNSFQHANINRLKKLASKYDLYVTDTSEAFKNMQLSQYVISKIDQHPNAKANKIFARVIYSYLKEQRLLGNDE